MKNFRKTTLVLSVFVVFLCLTITAHVVAKGDSGHTNSQILEENNSLNKPLENGTVERVPLDKFREYALPKELWLLRRYKPEGNDLNDTAKIQNYGYFEKKSYNSSNYQSLVSQYNTTIPEPDRIVKWTKSSPITVAVSLHRLGIGGGDDSITAAQNAKQKVKERFNKIKTRMEQVTGLSFQFLENPDGSAFLEKYDADPYSLADITIHDANYQVSEPHGRDYHAQQEERKLENLTNSFEASFRVSSNLESDVRTQSKMTHKLETYATLVLNNDYSIRRGICNTSLQPSYISDDYVEECLLSILGLPGRQTPSRDKNKDYSMLQILYNPQILPGFNAKQLEEFF